MHLAVVVADLGRFAQMAPFIAHARGKDVVIVDRHCHPAELVRYLRAWPDRVDTTELVLTDMDRVDCGDDAHDWRPTETAARCAACGVVENLSVPLVFDRLICA